MTDVSVVINDTGLTHAAPRYKTNKTSLEPAGQLWEMSSH